MKSLSVRPLILCVQVVISTFPQASKMSGWCPCSSASSPPFSGGTPPRHETHVFAASPDITTVILALGGAKAGDRDARCGHGVRVGVESGARGKVSCHRGP